MLSNINSLKQLTTQPSKENDRHQEPKPLLCLNCTELVILLQIKGLNITPTSKGISIKNSKQTFNNTGRLTVKIVPILLSAFIIAAPITAQSAPAQIYVVVARENGVTAKDVIRTIQGNLNFLGYDAGPNDGIAGRKTRNAIREYQKYRGFPPTGTFTRAELDFFMKSGGNE
ncbi:MAG: hypothetical protein GXP05_05685 [Alphaproteobacteria bacterium]|nr:hypothetical protein [Alphaproteobacteria bacterium]